FRGAERRIGGMRISARFARVGEVQKFRSRRFSGERIFWRGMQIRNEYILSGVLVPPTHTRTTSAVFEE
ncbi:MAG: hypothetical protein Q8P01_00715, partial [bacterium]|nr:hypothetical protein [bacterium]